MLSISRAFSKASVALALTSATFFTTSASGQSSAARPNSTVAVSEAKPGSAGNRVAAEDRKPKDLEGEIEAMQDARGAPARDIGAMLDQQSSHASFPEARLDEQRIQLGIAVRPRQHRGEADDHAVALRDELQRRHAGVVRPHVFHATRAGVDWRRSCRW